MDNIPDVIAQLNARIETLERRVFILEHSSEVPLPVPAPTESSLEIHSPQDTEALSFANAGGIFPVLSKAVLGVAGAYLLRAVAESGALPKLAIVVLAITYAGMWLVWAGRGRTAEWLTGVTYAMTSALILAPMLWELTLRFKVLPPSVSAAVLAAFATAALALTWKRNLASVFWVTYSTAMFTALVLMIATQDLVPFLWAILLIVFASEFAAYRGHRLNARILVAVVADIAVSSLIFIYTAPEDARSGYNSVSMPVLLALVSIPFLIYVVSVTIQTVLRHQRITTFEITQIIIAFLLAIYGVMKLSPSDPRVAIGLFCLVLSGAGYAAAFACFSDESVPRNFQVYTAWSAALFLLGSFFCFPQMWLPLWFGIAAITATLIGAQRSRPALELQGAIYLVAAAFVSGLLEFACRSLIGSLPATPTWIIGAIFASAFLCYLLGGRFLKDQWTQRLPHLTSATLTAGAGAALLVSMLARFSVRINSLNTGPLEFIQTLTTCSVALALAYVGSRWRRDELIWIAYATLVFIAAKLLLEDLRHGHLVFIAASFFLYAATLILLPRLAGSGHTEQTSEVIN